MSGKTKTLVDFLVSAGYFDSHERALFFIKSGMIVVNGMVASDRLMSVNEADNLEIRGQKRFVSRGGDKLEHVLTSFRIKTKGMVCIDAGSSTGGFTDCLLQAGAGKVICVDVGYGQLAWKLRQDDRVKVLERTNFRYVDFSVIGEKVDIVTMDLSFISLDKVLSVASELLKPEGFLIALVKPQFELAKGEVDKGGVIKSREKHWKSLKKICDCCYHVGLDVLAIFDSPILGKKGNREFFVIARPRR